MPPYTIQITNASGFAKNYVAFMSSPTVTCAGGPPSLLTNAWGGLHVADGGFASIAYDGVSHAYWAATTDPLASGITFASGGVMQTDLSRQLTVPFVSSKPTGFLTPVVSDTPVGTYAIQTADDFTAANDYVLGLAATGVTKIPTPVATFLAEPQETFVVTPTVAFHVAEGSYLAGDVLPSSVITGNRADIVFTALDTKVIVTQGANGDWSVAYS